MVMIRQLERSYTADDLAQMPDDGRRYEVLGGELIVSPSLSDRHQTVLTELMLAVGPFIREQRLGKMFPAPFDVYFCKTKWHVYEIMMHIDRDQVERRMADRCRRDSEVIMRSDRSWRRGRE